MAEKKSPSWEDKFEKKMNKLEKRLDEMGNRLEDKGEAFGKQMEDKAKHWSDEVCHRNACGHSLFWGIVLIVIGFLWLGRNLDWFMYDIPWVPVIFIALGIYFILRNHEYRNTSKDKEET